MHPPSAKIVGLKRKVAGPHLGGQNDAYFEQKRVIVIARAGVIVSRTQVRTTKKKSPRVAAMLTEVHGAAHVFNPKDKETNSKTLRKTKKQIPKCRDSRVIFIARAGVKVSRTQMMTRKSRRQELRRCSRRFTELHTFSTPKTKKQIPKR